jgi:hypothetical protein
LQDKTGIEDYYTQNTRQNLYNTIKQNAKHEINIESTTLKHNPKLDFTVPTISSFTDQNVVEYQKYIKRKKLIAAVQDTASYKVMMLLKMVLAGAPAKNRKHLPIDTVKYHPVFKIKGDNKKQ